MITDRQAAAEILHFARPRSKPVTDAQRIRTLEQEVRLLRAQVSEHAAILAAIHAEGPKSMARAIEQEWYSAKREAI